MNIIIGIEKVTLYFDKGVDLSYQRSKLLVKVKDLDKNINVLTQKLTNKSFLINAPKQIVQKEKNSLHNYKIELKKLNSILNSIKN